MKTREQVEELKRDWLKYPEWDLEGAEGFEEYSEELAQFRAEKEAEFEMVHNRKCAEEYMRNNHNNLIRIVCALVARPDSPKQHPKIVLGLAKMMLHACGVESGVAKSEWFIEDQSRMLEEVVGIMDRKRESVGKQTSPQQ